MSEMSIQSSRAKSWYIELGAYGRSSDHVDLQHDLEKAEELARCAPEELRDIAWPYRWKLRLFRPWLETMLKHGLNSFATKRGVLK